MSNKPFTLKLAAKKIAQVYREEGITKLWKGNTATVLRVIPYSATQFASFRGYSHLIVADDYMDSVIKALLKAHPYETPAFQYWKVNM